MMNSSNNTALRLEGVSKLYRLGEVGTGTLAHDLNRWWHRMRGKEDPYEQIGAKNVRETSADEKYVWALKDIDLTLKQGDILGIIGNNGAGKSTLLKLLSRVTAPTQGNIYLNGKIASLLEVGTGFHPELTGRENIYLNGAILGMTRREVSTKFDEIVEFSGCAKYVDTPVKRYSSGMHVRLAFAVAAHLEPDILVVDEVLAVGDAEFQKRCLGKLQDVSESQGRTVLFVSHNMASIKSLCPESLLMAHGQIVSRGGSFEIIEQYLANAGSADRLIRPEPTANDELRVSEISVVNAAGSTEALLATGDDIQVRITYEVLQEIRNLRIVATVTNLDGVDIFSTSDFFFREEDGLKVAGHYETICFIPPDLLTTGRYNVTLDFEIPMERSVAPSLTLSFEVTELSHNQLGVTMAAKPLGVVHPALTWNTTRHG